MAPEAPASSFEPVDHVRAWRRFRATALSPTVATEPGIQVVWIFYASLHLLQAYLLTKGERFMASNHGQRRVALRGAPELRPLRVSYTLLQDASEQVRYDPTFVATSRTCESALAALARVEAVLRGPLERALGSLDV